MKNLGQRIESALPNVQPRVEEILGVELGEIGVFSFLDYISQSLDYFREEGFSLPARFFARIILGSFFGVKEFYHVASAGDSKIYHSRSSVVNMFQSDINVDLITAHELSHIAHTRLVGNIEGCPIHIREGFAEYVGREVVSKMRGTPYEKLTPRIFRSYEGFVNSFRKLIKENEVSNNQELVDFIKIVSSEKID